MFVFIHLFNDRSGSPQVLSQVVKSVQEFEGNSNQLLYVGSEGSGLLDQLAVDKRKYFYRRSPKSKYITLIAYFASQTILFFKLTLNYKIDRSSTIYVNTLLPFGAAIFGKLTGKKVIYHLHEVSLTPKVFNSFLIFIAKKCGDKFIYVSRFHRDILPICLEKSVVIHNCVPSGLYASSRETLSRQRGKSKFQVLMLASLRDYKGIPEFLKVAEAMLSVSNIEFLLVANGDSLEIQQYFSDKRIPKNTLINPSVIDPTDYYQRADILLNLSRVDLWVETFGLTILEGMAFGIPVIAPTVGGPSEFVRDKLDGFLLDSRNTESICEAISALESNDEMYESMSKAAKVRSEEYTPSEYSSSLVTELFDSGT